MKAIFPSSFPQSLLFSSSDMLLSGTFIKKHVYYCNMKNSIRNFVKDIKMKTIINMITILNIIQKMTKLHIQKGWISLQSNAKITS